jgi:YVTN family beta-propeller protein
LIGHTLIEKEPAEATKLSCAGPSDRGYLVNNMKYLTNLRLCTAARRRNLRVRRLSGWLAATAIFAFAAQLGITQTPANSGEPVTGLNNPSATVYNPTTGKVYTVDAEADAVQISDDAAGTTVRVKVGAEPVSIAADSNNGRAYVANAGDGTVSVIDGKTDAVLATVAIGANPYSIAADSAAGKIYVTRTYSDHLTVIDAATNQVSGIKAGSPDLLVVNPKTHIVYLLGYEGGNLVVLNGETQAVTESSVGMHAWGMALNSDTGTLYIARIGNAEVAVLKPGSASPIMIPTGNIPCSIAINPQTNMVYVANYADNSVTAIDGAKDRVVAKIPAGERPQAVAVDAGRNLIYVANTRANTVTAIDGATSKVLATLEAGKAPYALVVNPVSGKLHVANMDKMSFTVLVGSHLQSQHQ